MEASFWHQKWERGETGFHESDTNPLLVKHFAKLGVQPGGRVFLPLCGKTRDIAWLLGQGHRVVGAELSALAIEELFRELALQPAISRVGKLIHYSASNIDVLVGDIFVVTADALGPVDAIYDRAALVALPDAVIANYATHLVQLTGAAPQLLVSLAYDQRLMAGPQFSVTEDEIRKHYERAYQVRCVEANAVAGGLKGKVAATESAWILRNTGRRA
jgi:thiopurine S-methyltransferase